MMAKRLRAACCLVLFFLTGLAARVFYIQVLCGDEYSRMAQRQFMEKIKEDPPRGDILDRNGRVLSTSIESRSVFLRPREWGWQGDDPTSGLVRTALNISCDDWNRKAGSKGDFVWIARKLDPSLTKEIENLKNPALGVVPEQRRYYPNGRLACQLVGAVGMDNHGLSGVEQSLDAFLTGKIVVENRFKDGRGKIIEDSESSEDDRHNVVLTIDRTLQYEAESALNDEVEKSGAACGMALVQDPTTGELLACASSPGFDPNEIAGGTFPPGFKNSLLQNLAVNKMFEPGSTFKAITFSAGLQENKISLNEKVFCEEGRWKMGPLTIDDHEKLGLLTLSQVLENSSNIGTAKMALRLGKECLYRYARSFGFGARTGILLSGESEGILRPPNKWSATSLPILSFGQEVGATALQVINAYSAIANGGVLMEPQIIKQMESVHRESGARTVVRTFPPQAIRRVISPTVSGLLRTALAGVVERGTGTQAKVAGYSVAGKTGTAQIIDPKSRKYYADKYIASFCGFLPVDKPRLSCLVVIVEPKGEYWGGTDAAPVFSRIMTKAVQILGIPPDGPPVKRVLTLAGRP